MNGLTETTLKRRRAWLAALLSLLLPGLGQLYNHHVRLALTFIVVALLASIPGRWLVAAVPSKAVAAVAAIVVSVGVINTLFAIIQAAIGAKRADAIAPAWFNRWYVYLGLFVLVAACQGVASLLPISNIASYSIPSPATAYQATATCRLSWSGTISRLERERSALAYPIAATSLSSRRPVRLATCFG
jgi:hypothetical protein